MSKVKASAPTKRARTLSIIFGVLGFGVSVLPFLGYFVYGFVIADTATKLTMSIAALASGLVAATNIVLKQHLRCPLWILLLALYVALGEIHVLLIIAAVGCTLDELIFSPLHNHYKQLATINKTIDMRTTNN